MSILFKTYKGKHQLHLYQEQWVFPTKHELDRFIQLIPKKELEKVEIKPLNAKIEIILNSLILDCKDLVDLKEKFGILAEFKAKYQKIDAAKK